MSLTGNFACSSPISGNNRTNVGPTPPLQCPIILAPP